MSSPRAKALLFDVGGVVVRLKTRDFLGRMRAACESITDEQMLFELRDPSSVHMLYERGKATMREFHGHLQKTYGLRLDYGRFVDEWNDYFAPNPPMEGILRRLKGRARLWVLSNTNPEHKKYFTEKYPVFEVFERVIGSYETGYRKPEREIFEYALRQMAEKPGDVLYIDDLKANVDAAMAAGMRGFHYQFNDEEFEAYLVKTGVLQG